MFPAAVKKKKHHVLSPWRIVDANLELRQLVDVVLEHAFEVELLDFPLET